MAEELVQIRDAQPTDKEFVLKFTEKTWEWGDYIKYVWDHWLSDPNGKLLVADLNGKPIGILHVQVLPDKCAWFEGLRVHPDYRRRGIALKLNENALEFTRQRNLKCVRVIIVEWNKPSIRLAEKLGFKIVGYWRSFWVKYRDILKYEHAHTESKCDLDHIWFLMKKSSMLNLSSFYFPLSWRWFKISEKLLRELIKSGDLHCFLKRNNFILYEYNKEELTVCFTNFANATSFLKAIRYLCQKHELKEDAEIEIILPKSSELEKDLSKIIRDQETLLLFEKSIN